MKELSKMVCKKCRWRWTPRVAEPKKCPDCQDKLGKQKNVPVRNIHKARD